jgi:hypothetical protein
MQKELIKKYLIETVRVNPDNSGFQIPDLMAFLNLRFSEMVSTFEEMVRIYSLRQIPKVEPIAHA